MSGILLAAVLRAALVCLGRATRMAAGWISVGIWLGSNMWRHAVGNGLRDELDMTQLEEEEPLL